MTETTWLTASDPKPMLRYLIGFGMEALRVQDIDRFPDARGSDRRFRLFACACYDRISHLLPDPEARAAIRVAERFADGEASLEEFLMAQATVRRLADALEPRWRASDGEERNSLHPRHAALSLALVACWREPQKAAYYASSNVYLERPYLERPGIGVHSGRRSGGEAAEKQAQCDLLREMFGNPFRPIALAPEWRTGTAVTLAQRMYEERDFGLMPVLGDALQDAGCGNQELLEHCYGRGPHVRGCWAVDLVLGKEWRQQTEGSP